MKRRITIEQFLAIVFIIGTVALTAYMAVFNYQRKQIVAQLKQVYFTLSDTTAPAVADNGPVTSWKVGDRLSGDAAVKFADRYLIPYLKISKNCGTKAVGECEFKYRFLNNKYPKSSVSSHYTRFYLDDGTLIALSPIVKGERIDVWIDVSGQKPPNIVGKDIFLYQYYIYDRNPNKIGKFIPAFNGSTKRILKDLCGILTNKGDGITCAALIMRDNWRVKIYYPWD